MLKKISFLFIALIITLSLPLTTSIHASGVVDNSSMSNWFFVEPSELPSNSSLKNSIAKTDSENWAHVDPFIELSKNDPNYDTWHVFIREIYEYNGGVGAQDWHVFARVKKEYKAEPTRVNGRLTFQNDYGKNVSHEYLRWDGNNEPNNPNFKVKYVWSNIVADSGQGVLIPNAASNKAVTFYEKIIKPYDPNNPPGYAHPDYRNPDDGGYTKPPVTENKPPVDPDYPVQPTPPDNNWDLIGWVKYLFEWFIYVIKTVVYVVKGFGTAIADVFKGAGSLIEVFSQFFSFLPNQIVTVMLMGIMALIIAGLVRR